MNLKALFTKPKRHAAMGAALTAFLGLQFSYVPWLAERSYDLPTVCSNPDDDFAEVQLIEMDETSYAELRQDYPKWDFRLHAQLLDHLRVNGAKMVVFDVFFGNDRDVLGTRELARAIREHGRVVLAAGKGEVRMRGIGGGRVVPPIDELRNSTTFWGPTPVIPDGDLIVRQISPGTEQKPAVPWVAASLAGAPVTQSSQEQQAKRWVRYYGPGGTLPHVSYLEATNRPVGFFQGKTVFIGGRPGTVSLGDEVEEHPTPWRGRTQPLISGMELIATEFLNLSRGDFLTRMSTPGELGLVALLGILFGGGLACARPTHGTLLALAGLASVTAVAFVLFFQRNFWFNWCVVAFVQIPAALGWSFIWQWRQLKKEKEWLESPLPELWEGSMSEKIATPSSAGGTTSAQATAPEIGTLPVIPDHELVRRVGRGAYGDVWLARDALGSFHAVKIVHRETFEDSEPYEREFRGLQKFTPVSRAHPGLVHVLHVGRNTGAGYFYYVMEAGDDEHTGPTIDPLAYTPRNLGRELRRRAPLPLRECVELGEALCDALEFLHRQGLIHRDIKPANIIFVNRRPKLADIGLVTNIASSRREASYVGTEGYLAPEGPGTAAGDIYALGKVLEEMTQQRATVDAIPAGGDDAPEQAVAGWEEFRDIIRKACAALPEERFASAQAMREALLQVESKIAK